MLHFHAAESCMYNFYKTTGERDYFEEEGSRHTTVTFMAMKYSYLNAHCCYVAGGTFEYYNGGA